MSVHTAPRATPWPATGFVTVQQILGRHGGPLPVSRSTWWQGVKEGRYPQPLKIGGRTAWRVADINALLARLDSEGAALPRCRAAESTTT